MCIGVVQKFEVLSIDRQAVNLLENDCARSDGDIFRRQPYTPYGFGSTVPKKLLKIPQTRRDTAEVMACAIFSFFSQYFVLLILHSLFLLSSILRMLI